MKAKYVQECMSQLITFYLQCPENYVLIVSTLCLLMKIFLLCSKLNSQLRL